MFSTDKCTLLSGSGTSEESEMFAGGGESVGTDNLPSDEVASAVAAVSDEIGDILKDELGDADRADRIGAELAGLSAELGLLAGLAADGEPQHDFPTLLEIAMGHRSTGSHHSTGSSSSTSSSSYTGGRGSRLRRVTRPQRIARRRPIAKGKEMAKRRTTFSLTSSRQRRDIVSDASDVGGDCDSDDQWTELDTTSGSSDSLSEKEGAANAVCNGYSPPEIDSPGIGQFLLPLLTPDFESPQRPMLIPYDDISRLLASLEILESGQFKKETPLEIAPENIAPNKVTLNNDIIFPEDEAALLQYVFEMECQLSAAEPMNDISSPIPDWLQKVYHSWCEIGAFLYTVIGTNMSIESLCLDWEYQARFPCHCQLCLTLSCSERGVSELLGKMVTALARDNDGCSVVSAARLVKALRLKANEDLSPEEWDLSSLTPMHFNDKAAAIIHDYLSQAQKQSEVAANIFEKVCLCRPLELPFTVENALERLLKILENFKASSCVNFKVDLISTNEEYSWLEPARRRLAKYLQPYQRVSSSQHLKYMEQNNAPTDWSTWSNYKFVCECHKPMVLNSQLRKNILMFSFFGMMNQADKENSDKAIDTQGETVAGLLQQGDGTGAKPPEATQVEPLSPVKADLLAREYDSNATADLDDIWECNSAKSLDISSSSSTPSSDLADGSSGDSAPSELCRSVRQLMRCIASIERLMDTVLKHCDQWPTQSNDSKHARKLVDLGLSEVDRKLMAMYKRLPEVHHRQLQVYKKQKKLSSVCAGLWSGARPPLPPPPPAFPAQPPARPSRAAPLCLHYHLQRFREVRRKVMHMRDQQLYYHRLRMWLEDQLRHEKESIPENVSLVEDLLGRKRRSSSPKEQKSSPPKLKLRTILPSNSKSQKIIQILKHKLPTFALESLNDMKSEDFYEEVKSEVEAPEAFILDKDDVVSDTDTVVGEKESNELCKEMKECLSKFASFAVNRTDELARNVYPESVSPPLQEMSPTTPEPVPVYTPKSSQRLLAVNKLINRDVENRDRVIDFQSQIVPEVLSVPLNARRTPILVKDEVSMIDIQKINDFNDDVDAMDKYVTFGLEIKKAMKECQNIIKSYDCVKGEETDKYSYGRESPLTIKQICDIFLNFGKISSDESNNELNMYLIENMPQFLHNVPKMINGLSNDTQLTPETLKQIREVKKLSKNKDNVKVTKHTAKRKTSRRIKNYLDNDIQSVKLNKSIDSKSLDEDSEASAVFKSLRPDAFTKSLPCMLYENSVKEILSMDELRDVIKNNFCSIKNSILKSKSVPIELFEKELEIMLQKFYSLINGTWKQSVHEYDKIIDKIEQNKNNSVIDFDNECCKNSIGPLKHVSRFISTSADNIFDLLITKFPYMSAENKEVVKCLKFKYVHVLRRCAESQNLSSWILINPEIAINAIGELTKLPVNNIENVPEFDNLTNSIKQEYFLERLKDLNKTYMESLPKEVLSGDEWIIMLHSLEELEDGLCKSFLELSPPSKGSTNQASEAEILAAKGLGLLMKHATNVCNEADYLTKNKRNVLDTDNPKFNDQDKEPSENGNINSYSLAEFSVEAMKTLNAISDSLNIQTKSESDPCDIPKSDCKWTSDCHCSACKDNDFAACQGEDSSNKNVVVEMKNRIVFEENVKDIKPAIKPTPKQTKPHVSKACENSNHPHLCKVGHGNQIGTTCAGDANNDQPCTCCYCTVFGHAPPLTTPVPRNFNETRERLRSILNKKKQKSKVNNIEQDIQIKKQESPPNQLLQSQQSQTTAESQAQDQLPSVKKHSLQPQIKPPALPKTLPPNLTPAQAQQRKQSVDNQQKLLAEKMAKMTVNDSSTPQDSKPKALQRTVPIQVNVPSTIKAEEKVNPDALEQIRLQQIKQHQLLQQQEQLHQQQQKQIQLLQQIRQPEPIYDLPIHNKSTQQQNAAVMKEIQSQASRQSRASQRQESTPSSRDSSAFSTSLHCSNGSCWRDCEIEGDPRDLDALLQYIEGPTRDVDRAKKRAKKQRQKAKKVEAQLLEDRTNWMALLVKLKSEANAIKARNTARKRHYDELQAQMNTLKTKKKRLKVKFTPAQRASQNADQQQISECFAKLTIIMDATNKDLKEVESQIASTERRLQECEQQLIKLRLIFGNNASTQDNVNEAQMEQMEQALQTKQHFKKQVLTLFEEENRKQYESIFIKQSIGAMLKLRSQLDKDLYVSHDPPSHTTSSKYTVQNDDAPKSVEVEKKQTWEQALAHINQIAKGNKKEKKKKEVAPASIIEPKCEPLPSEQPLSKKQRKLLARQQQAEEEERLRILEQKKLESKSKKKSKKANKDDVSGGQANKNEKQDVKKKEDKKKDKQEKKGKENKSENNMQHSTKTKVEQIQVQQPTPANLSKKEKKKLKEQQKLQQNQIINITPDTTIEIVNNKKGTCKAEQETIASCSIMEQLSCGIQVSDLKLPPGITLTRVNPLDKREAPHIKSVPVWKASQLPAAPTPVARPPPVINADPKMMMFTTTQPDMMKSQKPIEQQPVQPSGKSKKAKKKAKKSAAAETSKPPQKEGTKMVTLRNPMFHPNLPQVQIAGGQNQQKSEIKIPEPIPMPPTACQATITPTSNGMYTIRNPLMSMMHQQSMMNMGPPQNPPQANPMYAQQPHYNYVNPNTYNPVPNSNPPTPFNCESRVSPNTPENDYQNRIMNLASFTQNNYEGYSLFKTSEDNLQRNFLAPEYFAENPNAKSNISPNPIGTRPNNEPNKSFDSNDASLFSNQIQKPKPIGTPLKRDEGNADYSAGLYTPFGQENRNVFRNALFNDNGISGASSSQNDEMSEAVNGDPLPYFQRLRVGSKLNNEVTIHHVTESKFYKGQDGIITGQSEGVSNESLFSNRQWDRYQPDQLIMHNNHIEMAPIHDENQRVGEPSVFLPDRTITNLSSLEVTEREIESFKRFDFYFERPRNRPKVSLDVNDIAAAMGQQHK